MGFVKRVLDNTVFRVLVAILGISAGVLAILNYVLPQGLRTPLVPAIVVSSVCLLIGGMFGIAALRSALDRTRVDSKRAYEYLRSRYGWGYEDLEVSGTIEGNGSAVITRKVRIKADQPQQIIEQTLFTDPADPAGDSMPTGVTVKSLTKGTQARLGDIKSSNQGGWLVEVYLTPAIAPGRTVGFELEQRLGPGFYEIGWSAAKLSEHGIEQQYFGWSIDRPTQSLHELVVFPENFTPTGYECQVKLAPLIKDVMKSRPHAPEMARMKVGARLTRKRNRYHMELEVDAPLIGLVYVMAWKPL